MKTYEKNKETKTESQVHQKFEQHYAIVKKKQDFKDWIIQNAWDRAFWNENKYKLV